MSKKGENIYKRKDGRWEGRYIRLRNIGGKAEYGYIYGKSYAEVKKKLMNAKVAVQLHAETREKSLGTYGQLLDDWLHSSKITVKDSTYARYTHLVQKHIKPHLGYLQFSQLTSQIVEDFIVSRLKAGRLDGQGGLAPKTVTDILTVIKSTIGYAKCSNYDVCCNLKRLSVKKGDVEMRVLTHTEQAALMINNCELDFYVSFDCYTVGVLQAQFAVEHAPTGNYFLISGSPKDNNALLMRNGQMSVLQPYIDKGDIKIVVDQWCDGWSAEDALQYTEDGLVANSNDVACVLTSNDGTAGGAIQALTEQGLAGKVVVTGLDTDLAACQRIVEGTQTMTIYRRFALCDETCVVAAYMLCNGEDPATKYTVTTTNNGTFDVPSVMLADTDYMFAVTSENMNVVIEDGWQAEDAIYKNVG